MLLEYDRINKDDYAFDYINLYISKRQIIWIKRAVYFNNPGYSGEPRTKCWFGGPTDMMILFLNQLFLQ